MCACSASGPFIPISTCCSAIGFPLGLILIVFCGGDLFTGNCFYSLVAWLEGERRRGRGRCGWACGALRLLPTGKVGQPIPLGVGTGPSLRTINWCHTPHCPSICPPPCPRPQAASPCLAPSA